MIPRIYICGTGNLGTALKQAFAENSIPLAGHFSGKPNAGFLHYDTFSPEQDSLVFLCVPDDAIQTTALRLRANNPVLIHCSGSMPLEILPTTRKGVFYPLQSFSSTRPAPDWSSIPVILQATDAALEATLGEIAAKLGSGIHKGDNTQRAALHLAAVFANNFSNFMCIKAWEICREYGLDPGMLKPLIHQTLTKLEHAEPRDSQTGPARRGDALAMEKHLELLSGNPGLKKLYALISAEIALEFRPQDRK